MNSSTKKAIKYLRRFVGHKIYRTKPCFGDWSYTSEDPLLLVGFTSDDRIIYRRTGRSAKELGRKESVLPIIYTDCNWITYKNALKAKGNQLNKWKGRKIRRIRPTATFGDHRYMWEEGVTLISASKYHMVIRYTNHFKEVETDVLRSDYMNPEDWELVE